MDNPSILRLPAAHCLPLPAAARRLLPSPSVFDVKPKLLAAKDIQMNDFSDQPSPRFSQQSVYAGQWLTVVEIF